MTQELAAVVQTWLLLAMVAVLLATLLLAMVAVVAVAALPVDHPVI